MDYNRPMTFYETFRAIRQGDWRVTAAFAFECLIMASGPALLIGAWYFGR